MAVAKFFFHVLPFIFKANFLLHHHVLYSGCFAQILELHMYISFPQSSMKCFGNLAFAYFNYSLPVCDRLMHGFI